jgi:hypothetical protein
MYDEKKFSVKLGSVVTHAAIVLQVRREMASALRDITSLFGSTCMIQEVAQLAQDHYKVLASAAGASCAATSSGSSALASSPAVGSTLFQGVGAGAPVQGSSVPAGAVGVSSSSRSDDMCSWSGLESVLYAANIVLGKSSIGPGDEEYVQMLSQLATATVTYPHGSLKLAGTALTLVGGLGLWFGSRPAALPALLEAVAAALKSPDEKLSRNAATCLQRLTGCDELSALLVQQQPAWVNGLLKEYQQRGGLQTQAGGRCGC